MSAEDYWPIISSPCITKVWSKGKINLESELLFIGELQRIGKKKKIPKSYFFLIDIHGMLAYKTESGLNKSYKGYLQLSRLMLLSQNSRSVDLQVGESITLSFTQSNMLTLRSFYTTLRRFCTAQNFESEFKVEKHLGQGSFGQVVRIRRRATNEHFAGKIYYKSTYDKHSKKKTYSTMALNEIMILSKVQHKGIVRLYEVYQQQDMVVLVMELLQGKELYANLVKKKRFTEQEAASITYQVALSLLYLHSMGYVHRDIKLDNIMFSQEDELTVKLVDFGFAEPINRYALTNRSGTPGYVPPEIFQLQPYTEKGDIFSLGAVLYALVSGYSLFVGRDVQQVTTSNKKCRVNFSQKVWKSISKRCKFLIINMLQINTQQRYDCRDVLYNDWITSNVQLLKEYSDMDNILDLQGLRMEKMEKMESGGKSSEFVFDITPRGLRSIHHPSFNNSRQSQRTTPTISRKFINGNIKDSDASIILDDMEDNSEIDANNVIFLGLAFLFNQPKKP